MAKKNEDGTPAATATAPERGPVLTWNRDRDIALVTVVRSGTDSPHDAVEILSGMGEFSGVTDAITPEKIRARVNALRKAGVTENCDVPSGSIPLISILLPVSPGLNLLELPSPSAPTGRQKICSSKKTSVKMEC